MSFPRYPNYKPSGVEWLGDVPVHWGQAKVGHCLKSPPCYGVLVPDFAEDGVPMLRITDMEDGNADRANMNTISPSLSAQYSRTIVEEGDVVISVVGTIGKAFRVGAALAGVNLSRAVARLQVGPELSADFLCWVFQSLQFRRYVDLVCVGKAQRVLNMGDLSAFRIGNPELAEQTAIAEFLDRETGKIDELVAEQRRLMELLKEKRQAVISHAVTQGLNPHAPMKPSGIEWLGDVPAHWDCFRNKVVFEEISERSLSEEGELMSVSHITGVSPRSEKDVNMFLAETLEGYKKCRSGDLVINTMWAWMGALGCSPCDGLVSPAYNVYRQRKPGQISSAYYDYLCRLPPHVVAMKANSSGVWESRLRLYPDAFLSMCLPVPPLDEQLSIVEYLSLQISKFDALTAEAQRAIDLLQERRTALISAAVTGQIDVRNHSPKR